MKTLKIRIVHIRKAQKLVKKLNFLLECFNHLHSMLINNKISSLQYIDCYRSNIKNLIELMDTLASISLSLNIDTLNETTNQLSSECDTLLTSRVINY